MAETRGQVVGGLAIGLGSGIAILLLAHAGKRALGLGGGLGITIHKPPPRPVKTGRVGFAVEYDHEKNPAAAAAVEFLEARNYLTNDGFDEILRSLHTAIRAAEEDPELYESVEIVQKPRALGRPGQTKGEIYYEMKASGMSWSAVLARLKVMGIAPGGTSTLQKNARNWAVKHDMPWPIVNEG